MFPFPLQTSPSLPKTFDLIESLIASGGGNFFLAIEKEPFHRCLRFTGPFLARKEGLLPVFGEEGCGNGALPVVRFRGELVFWGYGFSSGGKPWVEGAFFEKGWPYSSSPMHRTWA